MDGSSFAVVAALADVLEAAMRARMTFTVLRSQVYSWSKVQGHVLAGVDRLDGMIIVQYYSGGAGTLVTESVTELPAYTAAHAVSTW